MKEKINIAEILKDKAEGTKLYSPICGECKLSYVESAKSEPQISTESDAFGVFHFWDDGKAYNEGECLLFPSYKMREWDKFAWKRGDALSCGVYNLCIFEKWANKEYTEFYAKFVTPNYSGNTFKTEKWSKETNEAVIKQYISNIEEFKGGKLNLTTLEIEKTQPEFKDGDVLFVKCYDIAFIEIFKYSKKNGDLYDRASLDTTKQILDISGRYKICKDDITELRLATEEEKQKLFDALAKEGKRWDSEKKSIVDLKAKVELKPFDRVLVRDFEDQAWQVSLFSYKDSDSYYCCNGCAWNHCIPYIGNESLLGTTKDVEG